MDGVFGGESGAKANGSAIWGLYFIDRGGIMFPSMAIKVTRKDQNEANENIIRRFKRRLKAIIREARKAEKTERIKLGLK